MTTPVNSFQDILDAMERDPILRDVLRRHIITEEFLTLPAQVVALVTETRDLRAGQEQLRGDVQELREGQQELRTNVGRMGGDVSRLLGTNYEGKATVAAPRLARRIPGLTGPTVVGRGWANNLALPLPEEDRAAERGDITWDEADDIVKADVIVSATDQDGAQRYVLAEISITMQDSDRIRAHRRAALLEKATGVPTIPVVIGISEVTPESDGGVAFWQFDRDD